MCELLSEREPVAKKDHYCMASEWLTNSGMEPRDMTLSEAKSWVRARQNRYKIIKGQKYVNQSMKDGGEFYTFKAIPEIHKICLRYDLYDC